MKLHTLSSMGHKKPQRLGRGNASKGSFCGRGCKGMGQRKSGNVRPGFEGGQTPLIRRLPKLRGFNRKNLKIVYQAINIGLLDRFSDGDTITSEMLFKSGLISSKDSPVKILGDGELSKKVVISKHIAISESALKKLTQASGSREE